MAVRITAADFAREVLQAAGIVLVDFYSDSCLPCKRLAPVLAELEEEIPALKVVKVNAAYEKELVKQYGIQAAPTMILFQDGAEAARIRGTVRKDEIEDVIAELI